MGKPDFLHLERCPILNRPGKRYTKRLRISLGQAEEMHRSLVLVAIRGADHEMLDHNWRPCRIVPVEFHGQERSLGCVSCRLRRHCRTPGTMSRLFGGSRKQSLVAAKLQAANFVNRALAVLESEAVARPFHIKPLSNVEF